MYVYNILPEIQCRLLVESPFSLYWYVSFASTHAPSQTLFLSNVLTLFLCTETSFLLNCNNFNIHVHIAIHIILLHGYLYVNNLVFCVPKLFNHFFTKMHLNFFMYMYMYFCKLFKNYSSVKGITLLFFSSL